MATSPTSYLQTLAKDEAIAFVASLQSVKAHLRQALQWMEAQVKQKTVQLQGIETLLSEAAMLGLVTIEPHSVPEAPSAGAVATSDTAPVAAMDESDLQLPTQENGSPSPVAPVEPEAEAIAALPVRRPAKQPPGQRGKAAKTPRGSQSAATKIGAAKAKPSKPSTSPASKGNQRGKVSNLQQFLKSQWRDIALTAAVGDILDQSSAPLSIDEVMAALYDGLPPGDYDRAKHSLSNILSMGKGKGAWRSMGRGRYASKSVATP